MIKKLDRYIIGKYLKTFFFVVLLFSMVSVVIELTDRIERMLESELTWSTIAIDYLVPFIPWINSVLWPLYALISVIFFTSRLADNLEIISIFNSGTSFYRFLYPYLICATLLGGFHFAAKNYIVPLASKKRLGIYNKHFSRSKDISKNRDIHVFLNPDELAYFNYYSKRDSSGHQFRLERFEEDVLVEMMKGEKLKLTHPPNGWTMYNYEHYNFRPGEEGFERFVPGELDTTLNLMHTDFIRYENENEMLTTPEIRQIIKRDRERGISNAKTYRLELLQRYAEPWTLIILTIIGVAVAARKSRGGLGLNLALGMIIGALYILFSKFAQTIAAGEDIPLVLGVWLPNIVFGLVAMILVWKAQK